MPLPKNRAHKATSIGKENERESQTLFCCAGLYGLVACFTATGLPLVRGQETGASAQKDKPKTTAIASKDAKPFASGPLHVSKRNPRYFEDAEGRIVYLTGSHTWSNVCDFGRGDPPPVFGLINRIRG